PLATGLAAAMERETESDRFIYLTAAADAIDPQLDSDSAAALIVRLVTLLGKRNTPEGSSELNRNIGALARRLDAKSATDLAQRFVGVLEQETDPERFSLSASLLAALSEKVDAGSAKVFAARLLPIMKQQTAPGALNALLSSVASLTKHMSPGDASPSAVIATRLLLMHMPTDRDWPIGSVAVLADLSEQLPQESRSPVLLLALSHGLAEEDSRKDLLAKRDNHSTKLADLCRRLTVEELVGVLKWPFTVGDAEAVVVGEIGRQTKSGTNDFWESVENARKLRISTVDGPATRPSVNMILASIGLGVTSN
ncbi:MAG: hypothetical protein ACRD3J_01175, partial [Thermoanaerobaculia bacterium]